MSLDPQSPSANDPDLRSVVAKLDSLDAAVAKAVRGARGRNRLTVLAGIVSVVVIGYWLWHAHQRISTEINPELVANVSQNYLEQYIPTAATQLETSLKDNAPSVIAEGESRLRALPVRLDDQFRSTARDQIKTRMPDLQERLYQSLKSGFDDAKKQIKKSPGDDDAARFRNLADSLTAVYRTDALKFTDELYANYRSGAGDIVNGLGMLAEAKNLTPAQTSQRNLVRDFLILAHDAAPPEERKMPEAN